MQRSEVSKLAFKKQKKFREFRIYKVGHSVFMKYKVVKLTFPSEQNVGPLHDLRSTISKVGGDKLIISSPEFACYFILSTLTNPVLAWYFINPEERMERVERVGIWTQGVKNADRNTFNDVCLLR